MTNIYSIPQYKQQIGINNNNYNIFSEFERKQLVATKSVVYNPEIKEGRKRSIIIKSGIAAFLAGAALSLASRRVRFNAVKIIESLRAHNEAMINKSREAIARKDVPVLLRAKIGVMRFINRVTSSIINFFGNIDHFKNRLTGQVADNIPIVSKGIHWTNNKLTPFFSGTVRKASVGKYQSAEKAAAQLKNTINELIFREPKLRKVLGSSSDDLVLAVKELSSSKAFGRRHKELQEALKLAVKDYNAQVDGLLHGSSVANAANRLVDGTISLDIAKTKLLPNHLRLLSAKRAVSFSHKEKVTVIDELLDLMLYTKNLKPDPALIKRLQVARQAYAKAGSPQNRDVLLKVLEEASNKIQHPAIKRALVETTEAVTSSSPGQIQILAGKLAQAHEVGHINGETYKALLKQLNDVQNKTAKAVKFEKVNLSGRLLDIAIGPVPLLETTSLAIPGVVLAHEMVTADNKQERISNALIYTPTIVGGLGATVYALQKGIFGFNAMLFGMVSGYIFNRLGTFVDNKYYSKGREFNTVKMLASDQTKNPGIKILEV